MRLTDVVSSLGLAGYAELALILFLLSFVVVALQLLVMREPEAKSHAALPLDLEKDVSSD